MNMYSMKAVFVKLIYTTVYSNVSPLYQSLEADSNCHPQKGGLECLEPSLP